MQREVPLSNTLITALQASVMRELKMKRFKAYAAKLRATIRQIKQDGGSGMGVSRDDIAQHVGGGAEKKKEKVRVPAHSCTAAAARIAPPPPTPHSTPTHPVPAIIPSPPPSML